jgi:hypothetical protein
MNGFALSCILVLNAAVAFDCSMLIEHEFKLQLNKFYASLTSMRLLYLILFAFGAEKV